VAFGEELLNKRVKWSLSYFFSGVEVGEIKRVGLPVCAKKGSL